MPSIVDFKGAMSKAHWLPMAVALVVSLGMAPSVAAQSPDSMAALLHSPSFSIRQAALDGLRALPPSAWTDFARTTLFEQLVTEGQLSPSSVSQDGAESSETRGTYQIDLVRAALALNDSRSLEGMIWLGMQTDGDAVTFVARSGEPAIPFLERAWIAGSWRRPAVLEAAMDILSQHQELSESARTRLVRIEMEASGFEWALEPAVLNHPEFAAAVAYTADSGSDEVQRSTALEVLPGLLSRLSSATAAQLWANERLFTMAACGEHDRGRCAQIQNLWDTIDRHIRGSRWIAASNGLDAFMKAARVVCADPAQATVCRSLIGNAEAVSNKVNQQARH